MSDLPERAVIRANGRSLFKLALMTLVMLAIEALLLFAWPAQAEEWTPPDLPCVPTVSDFEHGFRVQGNTFAIVWWCD